MSAFEFKLTPTRQQKERIRNEDKEPTLIDLRPFTGKSIVTFDGVPVSKTAHRTMIISNYFDEAVKVMVTKCLKPEFNVSLEWTSNTIAPQSQVNLDVSWTPLKVVSCREVLQISDIHGNKKDVSFILKSFELKKTMTRKIAPMGYQKKLKLKTPSPPRHFLQPKSGNTHSTTEFSETPQSMPLPLSSLQYTITVHKNQENEENFNQINISYKVKAGDKENASPVKTPNTLELIRNLHLNPTPEANKPLHLLPTPVGTTREDIIVSRMLSRRALINDENLADPSKTFLPDIRIEGAKEIQIEATDEINEIEIIFKENQNILGKTQTISTLCAIDEDELLTTDRNFQETFKVNKSESLLLLVDDSDKKSEDRMSESMRETNSDDVTRQLRTNQGSMPNLNEMNSVLTCIEDNRYFRQPESQQFQQNLSIESTVSHADFREIEICAQSSRLNLDDSDLNAVAPTPIKESKVEKSPRKYVKEISSPTVKRVMKQDSEFKSPLKVMRMIFSPPRNNLSTNINDIMRRETFDIESRGRMIRATTWKQKQAQQVFAAPKTPKTLNLRPSSSLISQSLHSLSSLSVASVTSTCSMPANLTSGRLYNENHVNAYNNNDPFSATTTIDPFLSSTMYLEEQTLDRIEKTYMKWLNALVTIPPDLDSSAEKIDLGKLFTDAQKKELTFAPTKEMVCSRYYTSRLDSLRSVAVKFFHSDTIAGPLNKVFVMMNDPKKLGIRTERCIHLDLVLQRSLLELLLCYNPLWLRIGLEVVFNVQLNLNSNQDIYGMSRFIITNMFKSSYLAEKYSKFSQQSEYLEKLRKHTVKSFLFIIFFLDRAKEHRLIKKNPCLFVKRAEYKESSEILKKFASLVLSNYGDIIRMLKRFDYVVTHKQTVIDEFDYAFKNLAVDLRDGVRLTKVMEIILMRDDLVQKVRVPAISRLQKVYNVDLALKALEAADYKILGNITSKDIADGHREKTLSLLWQIIYKFRAPRFNAAAKTIQKFWKAKYLEIVINQRIEEKKQQRYHNAALTIQKHFRAWRVRRLFKAHIERVKHATIVIQKTVRGFLARQRIKQQIQKIVAMQRWYRRLRVMFKLRKRFVLKRRSAVVIQKWWRRQKLARQIIASSVVIKEIQHQALVCHQSAVVIQRSIKSFFIHKKFHAIIEGIVAGNQRVQQENSAATKIQSMMRMKRERRQFLFVKEMTITIQRWWRFKCEGRKQHENFLKLKEKTMKIQQWYRGVLTMRKQQEKYRKERILIIAVQRRFRANLLMKKQREEFLAMKSSALVIQQKLRAMFAMRKQRNDFLTLKSCVTSIQNRYRATLKMKIDRKSFVMMKESSIKIQRKLRATLLARKVRFDYFELRLATISIQQHYRAILAMRKAQKLFAEMKAADTLMKKQIVMKLENRILANKHMKVEREKFVELRQTVIIIQRKFRLKLLARKERQSYQTLRVTVIKMQSIIRGRHARQRFQVMKKVHGMNLAATKIQSIVRMNQQQSQYLKIKHSIIKIQKWWRNNCEARKQQENFLLMKLNAIKIQKWYRGVLKMRVERNEFIKQREFIIKIQRQFRGNLMMKKQRNEYQKLKSATITMQRIYRATSLMKKQESEYLNIRLSVITIQIRFRATMKMKIERKKFLDLKRSSVTIQRKLRATLQARKARCEFLQMKLATLCIQERYRAVLAMRKAQKLLAEMKAADTLMKKQIVMKLGDRFLARKLMKVQREKFLELRQIVIFIQRRFRMKLLARHEHQTFTTIRVTVVHFQSRIRGYQARQRFEELKTPENLELRKRHKAARLIQASWRGYYVRRKECNNCFKKIVSRLIIARNNVDPAQTLAAKLKTSLESLRSYDSNLAISLFAKLEYMSRIVPWILVDDAEFISVYCYGIMAQAIRSEMDKQIIENVTKFHHFNLITVSSRRLLTSFIPRFLHSTTF
ncbi:CLUMA_CG017003, isoform B [Clunio marinus]|uniref:CLUMA_CG017003, isoform B n=1 Tax=Clunio marinus TaxID=568069 RepID=A0A1J1IUM1_9DIPT|nr:CLUMA_CG017003, isoform B [Clunio marinus]